jgi:hypothetical protein
MTRGRPRAPSLDPSPRMSTPAPDSFHWGVVRDVPSCPTCHQPRLSPHRAVTPVPNVRALLEHHLADDQGKAQATDGCLTEVDRLCPHGHPAWALQLGLV